MASPAIVLVLVCLWATVDAGNVPVQEPLTVSIVDGPRVVDGNNVVASFTSSRPSATLKCKLSGLPRIDCECRDDCKYPDCIHIYRRLYANTSG